MPRLVSFARRRRAFSLTEVMIAVLLLSIYTTAIFGSVMYASKTARLNGNAIMAKNLTQGLYERVAALEFHDITPDNPLLKDVMFDEADATKKVWLDQSMGVPCQVQYRLTGYGVAESGSTSSMRDSDAAWDTNEWRNSNLYVVSGSGWGQYARITGNTSTQLTLATTLPTAIGAGAKYMINGGKKLAITTTWRYQYDPSKPAGSSGEHSIVQTYLLVPEAFTAELGLFE